MPNKSRQTQSARYVIHIPSHDKYGHPLMDHTPACYQQLRKAIPNLIHSMHVEGPYAGHTGSAHLHHHMHVIALDTPITDSHIKQLATNVGDWGNHQSIFVTKEGSQGLQPWTIPNRHHTPI